ncbi:MAG: kynureninase [Sedimentibacter sp.]
MQKFENTLAFAKELDEKDPLREYKDRFYIQENMIYMDGNSCGLCSKDAEKYVLKALEDWKKYGIDLWTAKDTNYFLYQDKLGAMLAPLINADPKEVTVCTNTTINIHKAVSTFYHPNDTRNKIIMDDLNFPTDKYAVYSQIKLHGYNPEECLKVVESRDGQYIYEDDIIDAMTDDVCMVILPSVLYRSAQLVDMEKIARAARERDIIVGFDLCHSIGAVPHDFKAIDCDFAVWCNYKYISGGPGAIAGLYINKKHFKMEPGMAGWHGNIKETQFNLEHKFEHAEYAGGWQTGTQPILSMAPIEGSLKMYAEAGIEKVREKSLKITAYMMYLIDTKLEKYGFSVGNPREDKIRGGHVALVHKDAIRITKAMKDNDIIPDFRFPNVIRLAPIALYTSYEDVYEMVERIIKIMENKEYEKYDDKRGIVA